MYEARDGSKWSTQSDANARNSNTAFSDFSADIMRGDSEKRAQESAKQAQRDAEFDAAEGRRLAAMREAFKEGLSFFDKGDYANALKKILGMKEGVGSLMAGHIQFIKNDLASAETIYKQGLGPARSRIFLCMLYGIKHDYEKAAEYCNTFFMERASEYEYRVAEGYKLRNFDESNVVKKMGKESLPFQNASMEAQLRSDFDDDDKDSFYIDIRFNLDDDFGQKEPLLYLLYGPGAILARKHLFPILKTAAEKGIVNAYAGLGFCYELGLGVEQDSAKALEWYRKSANAGNSVGMYEMGLRLLETNKAEGNRYFKQALDKGHKGAKQRVRGKTKKKGKLVFRIICIAAMIAAYLFGSHIVAFFANM